jgi:hypothetical protein
MCDGRQKERRTTTRLLLRHIGPQWLVAVRLAAVEQTEAMAAAQLAAGPVAEKSMCDACNQQRRE